jgi:hypothetical protein
MPIEAPAGTLEVENAKFRASSVEATIAVGIGTESNDAYPLQIFKETAPDIRLSEGSTISSAARFYSNNSNLYIQTGTDFTSGSAGDVAFQTMGGQSTHMVIKSDGKVGVGTASPTTKLHVYGNILGHPVIKTRTITKGASLNDETKTFTLNPDENRIVLNNNQGSVGSTRRYRANFTSGVPTTVGTVLHLEINSQRVNTDATARGHQSVIQFDGTSILDTGYIILSATSGNDSYDRKLQRTIILTDDGWKDYSMYPKISAPTTDDAIIFSTTEHTNSTDLGSTELTERMRITDTGNIGIGTTSPSSRLHVNLGNASGEQHIRATQTSLASSTAGIRFGDSTWDAFIDHSHGSKDLMNFGFYRNPTRQVNMVLTHEGRVGIGTTNPSFKLDIVGGSTAGTRDTPLRLQGDGSDIVPLINAGSGGGTIKTIAGLEITSIDVPLSTHGRHSYIEAVSAGSTYNTDLEFRARTTDGYYKYGGSSNPTTKQARISHNGYIYARVGTSGTGADYAELFEWDDGNQGDEDRTGMTVKLTTGGKIAIADTAENVIGVVSVIYGFLGNDQWDEWVGKYVKDSLGRTVNEDVKMVTWRDENDKECTFKITHVPNDITIPENAVYYTHQSPKINPEYDKTKNYVGRSQRKEWSAIGLVGRLRILKGYPKSPRWIKIQDIDENVEEYLAV